MNEATGLVKQKHARVKELFLQARELTPENREEFLRRECGEDTTLGEEVTSLLDFDNSKTILARPDRLPVELSSQVGRPRGGLLGRLERAVSELLQQVLIRPGRRIVVVIVAISLLAGIAVWTHSGMKRATQTIAASELQTILNADIKALELWIEEKKKDVLLWSSRPNIRQAVHELVQIANTETELQAKLLASPALTDLRRRLEKYDRIVGRPEEDAVFTRDGLTLCGNRDEMVGQRLNVEGIAALVPVFQGQTLFIRPQPNGTFELGSIPDLNTPVVFVAAPIRRNDADTSEIIAAAGFGFPADGEFTQILSVARQGESGETYTFDEQGLLLSESRFDEALRDNGMLPEDPRSRSIFRIEIRDPGAQPAQRPRSSVEAAEQPLTRLAAAAIAAGRKGSQLDLEGVIVEPYRNYRGARVIGAWKWLSAYSFAVATEVEVDEQFAPMRFPLDAEWIRFGLLAACFTTLLAAACWIAVLGRDVYQARQLGEYTLEEKIGEGGMSVVYRARHSLLQRPTAIKLLRLETVNIRALARFEREVQLASGLTHPNTIDIFDFGKTPEGTFYCVMEFLDGRSLDEVVRLEGPLAVPRAVNILLQIAHSLGEAHNRGLVHRDIKPSNVMLCEQGGIPDFIKVLDFGLARNVEQSDGQDLTQPGFAAGTPSYMAPERITDPTLTDQRSDIYSLGAVGYYLLAGRNVFEAAGLEHLVRKILYDEPRRPSEVTGQGIPQALEEFILRCLARDCEDRPATMQELTASLTEIDTNLAGNDTGV